MKFIEIFEEKNKMHDYLDYLWLSREIFSRKVEIFETGMFFNMLNLYMLSEHIDFV